MAREEEVVTYLPQVFESERGTNWRIIEKLLTSLKATKDNPEAVLNACLALRFHSRNPTNRVYFYTSDTYSFILKIVAQYESNTKVHAECLWTLAQMVFNYDDGCAVLIEKGVLDLILGVLANLMTRYEGLEAQPQDNENDEDDGDDSNAGSDTGDVKVVVLPAERSTIVSAMTSIISGLGALAMNAAARRYLVGLDLLPVAIKAAGKCVDGKDHGLLEASIFLVDMLVRESRETRSVVMTDLLPLTVLALKAELKSETPAEALIAAILCLFVQLAGDFCNQDKLRTLGAVSLTVASLRLMADVEDVVTQGLFAVEAFCRHPVSQATLNRLGALKYVERAEGEYPKLKALFGRAVAALSVYYPEEEPEYE